MNSLSKKDYDTNLELFAPEEIEEQLEQLVKNIVSKKPEYIDIWQKLSTDNKRELIITNNKQEYVVSTELNKHNQTQNNIKCVIIFNNNQEDIVYNYNMIIKELYKETRYIGLLDKEVIEVFSNLFFD